VLAASADLTFTTTGSAPSGGGGGTSVPLNTWTRLQSSGWPVEIMNYDKSEYISSRKLHCVFGAYKQYLSSEHNNAIICYSYPENRWHVLENTGYWHGSHAPGAGHTVSIWAYMPDKDAIAYQADGSGSNSPESFLGGWWWYDVGGLSGQNRSFTPRNWIGTTTPWQEAMTYDPVNRKLFFYDINMDLEICDPNSNSCWKPTISGQAPPSKGITSPNLVYNSGDGKMYFYGGGQPAIYTYACSTAACTTVNAAQLAVTCTGAACVNGAPPVRVAAGMAYSPKDNIFMMAGGIPSYALTTWYSDTWFFDPTARSWTQVTPPANYYTTRTYFTADRLTYDPDSNVFLMMSVNGYTPTMYAYAHSPALNYGRATTSYTPPPGSLNRAAPTPTSQSWSFDHAITESNGEVYLGWVETGANADNSLCGQTHHPYIQSSRYDTNYTFYPGGSMSQACVAIDPELKGATNGSKLRMAVVNGVLWEAHEKINHNQYYDSAAFARQWNGSTWNGGAVGCFSGACGDKVRQNPQALLASGGKPTIGVVEWNRVSYTPEGHAFVAQWNGTAWAPLGAKLNITGAGTQALDLAVATDGSNPAACWSEQVASNRSVLTITPQIQCQQWNGSAWARFGSKSLNFTQSTTDSWAYDPTMTYVGGKYYIGWTERSTSGNAKVYVCRWDGSTCTFLGGGALNIDVSNGWAAHPSLATDGSNVYLAWEEQTSLGQVSLGFVKKWNGSSWSQVGSALNADPAKGSVAGISLAVGQGPPTAIWGELTYGNLRQTYAKQWNGTAWVSFGATTPVPLPPPAPATCDLNGDGQVTQSDVQLALNQALGITPCTNASLWQAGQCSVVDVQRVINASLGAACRIGN
jgi:hypothetical protein